MYSLFVSTEDLRIESADPQMRPLLWNIAGLAGYHTGDRVVIFVFKLNVKQPLDLVHLGRAEHVIIAVLALDYLYYLLFLDVLVLDLAYYLLDYVLDGNDTGDATIFVDNDGYLDMFGLHRL